MSRIGKVVGMVAMAGAAALLGLGALVFVQPAAASAVANIPAVQAVTAVLDHGGGGYCGTAGLTAAAGVLGITTDELQTQLRAGESLSDQATTAGVDVADVLAAIDAACVQAQRDNIEAAVTAGTLTREKADWLLEGLDKGYWGAGSADAGFGIGGFGGFGPGGRHGGPGGHGNFGPDTDNDANPDQAAPTATPNA